MSDGQKECRKRAKELLDKYEKSKDVPVHDLYKDGGSLRAGDILSRKLDASGTSGSSGQYTSGSYSGLTAYSSGGIFIHYAIYYRSIGDDKHELIEKCEKEVDGTHICKVVVSTAKLKQYFKIVINCRYKATCDMALYIYHEKLDAGYSFSHSNCEHFVTFCLTRHGHYSISRQAQLATVVRDTFGLAPTQVLSVCKFYTHPFYMMAGDMELRPRLLKTSLPFGLDSDGLAIAISNGSRIFIGYCFRAIPEPWYSHD